MVELELLVGADAFWRRVQADMASARRRLHVQAMTFEGDSVGEAVAAAIAESPAQDRRILVDAYTKCVLSDQPVTSFIGLRNPYVHAESLATDAMFQRLAAEGVGVRVTNPVGPLMIHYPARNHKKLIVADDVAYVGGVNFSDHNFAWSDLMLRLDGALAADFLAADFEATFAGRPQAGRLTLPDVDLFSLDGRDNARSFDDLAGYIDAARREVTVFSAYLTFPFTHVLARAVRRGVTVRLITPLANNKPLVRDYLLSFARRAGFEVRLTPSMSHLKGLLIDGERLVVGSSNFDFVSLAAEEEFLAAIDSQAIIDDFNARVIAPALAEALDGDAHRVSPLTGFLATAALKIAQRVAVSARNAPRGAADWPG